MICHRAKENNCIKSLNSNIISKMEERNRFLNYHNHNNIYFPEKKNYTCKETKNDPYTGKAAGNRNCERPPNVTFN